ncbi:putative membrane protein [Parabacteroides sp. PFB2-12]|uniref:hypothetical protein n=1 Tax=unclassified Parabacteroides TaxID=2649774 RepID=UPI0024737701|nr:MULTISPECIES: hypothetical protein [unclassified Parabacteroides]MDH6343762.1 putative membrane protein [Parabacteroides sp. PM6-13]MDH6391924.1 putative membrane protein [Parabacteroides sp. PFB2-12]
MKHLVKYTIIGIMVTLLVYVIYTHSQFTPILIAIGFVILCVEYLYIKLQKSKEDHWAKFINELEKNRGNAKWIEKKEKELKLKVSSDFVNKKLYMLQLDEINIAKCDMKNNNREHGNLTLKIDKIEFIRLVNILCEAKIFKNNKKDVMLRMGELVGDDYASYQNNLNSGNNTSKETQKKILDKLSDAFENLYNKKNEKI